MDSMNGNSNKQDNRTQNTQEEVMDDTAPEEADDDDDDVADAVARADNGDDDIAEGEAGGDNADDKSVPNAISTTHTSNPSTGNQRRVSVVLIECLCSMMTQLRSCWTLNRSRKCSSESVSRLKNVDWTLNNNV